MKVPPSIIHMNGPDPENRVTSILRNYWEYIAEGRPFPAESDIDPEDVAKIWQNCFIVEANNMSQGDDFVYKYLGDNIKKAFGEDFTGGVVDKVASPQASHLEPEYEKVLAHKTPVSHEGHFDSADGNKVVKYRQILLPLGEDGIQITAIIGGMSYKMFTAE